MASTVPALKEDRVIFAGGASSYTVGDVIDAAHFRGEVEPFWKELLVRVEAERKAGETEAELDGSEVDAAAVAFRYQYDLITAEETEAWLETRGLTLADFSEYFAREQWGKTLGGKVKPSESAYATGPAELRELLMVDLVMSGELDRMATRLAWRVATMDAAKGAPADLTDEEQKQFCERNGLNVAEIAHWLSGLDRDQAWFDQMMTLEAAYRARCAKLLTAEARTRELGALRLPLTRFEVEMIELESGDAAREAFMCVRDDGMSMADVAQEGRYPFYQTEMVLEQIADDLQQKFLSLTPGSILEPTPREDGFILTRILAKKEPTLDDPDVQARVKERILERHFADLTSGRIQWRLQLNNSAE